MSRSSKKQVGPREPVRLTDRVKLNEVTAQIAARHGFRDGGTAIWTANHALIGANPEVLLPSVLLQIPSLPQGEATKQADGGYTFFLPVVVKRLCLSFQSMYGKGVVGWRYSVEFGLTRKRGIAKANEILVDRIPLPVSAQRSSEPIVVFIGLPNGDPQQVELILGGLDPIGRGRTGRAAIQKILNNLGYYRGPIDGKFDANDALRAALRAFQHHVDLSPAHGMADRATCAQLIKTQGCLMPAPRLAPETAILDPDQNRELPLPLGAHAGSARAKVAGMFGYQEPVEPKAPGGPPTRSQILSFPSFPSKAYISPCDPGEESNNLNVIRDRFREFIFLDCGRWLEASRDFALIWGPHTYLCRYASPGMMPEDFAKKSTDYANLSRTCAAAAGAGIVLAAGALFLKPLVGVPLFCTLAAGSLAAATAANAFDTAAKSAAERAARSKEATTEVSDAASDRLDRQFFQQMNAQLKQHEGHIEVLKHACASWAPATDFDWTKVVVIIPDLHLMNGENAAIWYSPPGGPKRDYDLQAELDLLDFAEAVTTIQITDRVDVVQIGDSYDLWVGCSPRQFEENKTGTMTLKSVTADRKNPDSACSGSAEIVRNWIKDIQGLRANWVQGVMEARRGRRDSIEQAQRYKRLLSEESLDHVPTAWLCEAPICPGHSIPTGSCVPNRCRCIEPPCPGHADSSEQCGNSRRFTCRSIGCAGHEFPDDLCEWPVWLCGYARKVGGKWQKLCTGHTVRGQCCERRGWLNPAEKALLLLGDRLTFIYGNHDNYLIIPEINEGLPERKRYDSDYRGVFFEHGHRLEGTFPSGSLYPLPVNYDGAVSGYDATMKLYNQLRGAGSNNPIGKIFSNAMKTHGKEYSSAWASGHDQPHYRSEAARIWLGRHINGQNGGSVPPFHIYVIGHTHMPNLWYVPIDSWPAV